MGIKSFFSKLFGGGSAAEGKTSAAKKSCCCGGHEEKKNRASQATPEEKKANLRELEGFVEYVVKELVDFPDEVEVSSDVAADCTTIRIVCRPGDRGKIIGKKGKTITALRALVASAAGRLQNRVTVEVMDDENEVKN